MSPRPDYRGPGVRRKILIAQGEAFQRTSFGNNDAPVELTMATFCLPRTSVS